MSKETLWDKINKVGRYTLGSLLLKEVQEKMAEKYGEEPFFYTMGTTAVDLVGGMGLIVGGAITGAVPVAVAGICVFAHGAVDCVRGLGACVGDKPNSGSWGHPVITIPYYTLVKPTEKMALYLKKKINEEGKETLELYVNGSKNFKRRFEKLSEEEQEEILARVMSSEKRSKELDAWLGKNYGSIISSLVEVELKKEEETKVLQKEEKDPIEEVFKALTDGK